MKYFFLFFLVFIFSFSSNAQKGSVLLGGNIGFSKTNNRDVTPASTQHVTNNDVSVNPFLGYQFTKKITAGVIGSYIFSKNTTTETGYVTKYQYRTNSSNKLSQFSIGPFVRYTQKISNVFYIYGQLEGRYIFGKEDAMNLSHSIDSEDFTTTDSSPSYFMSAKSRSGVKGTNINLFPALFVNVKNGFGLNFDFGGISYITTKYGRDLENNSQFNVNFGKSIHIGISKNF